MKADKPFIEAMRHATQLIRMRGPRAATQFIHRLLRPAAGARAERPAAPFEDVEFRDISKSRAPEAPAGLPAAGGQFVDRRFSSVAGARGYKLYIPLSYAGEPAPLLVMLHGCTQNPDDFATGTRANRWAESRRFLVAYPEQASRANAQRCWNWFRPEDQRANHGEPAIVAGIVQQIIDEYRIDARRVYVAGLSAGGAMAAILGQAYPELFAAIGIHSGLPAGVAHNVSSALALMKAGQMRPAPADDSSTRRAVPLIVLHGDADRTVNPANATRLVENAIETHRLQRPAAPLQWSVQTVDATGDSHGYRRTRHATENGISTIEQWEIHGAGHAWSGGNKAGSFTDARGPDATRAMLEFFAQHLRDGAVASNVEAAADVIDSAAPM